MGWWLAYVGLLLALVVRVSTRETPARSAPPPQPADPLGLVAVHHAVFYLLLVAAPLEAALVGGVAEGRWAGLAAFAAGVTAYRVAGTTLGVALSPFVEPAPGATLVTHGVYRHVRHPMYLGQALMALGAPLTLGCRATLALSAVALVVLGVRVGLEERALRRRYPAYARYAESAAAGRAAALLWAALVYAAYWLRYLPGPA
jgi:protein-S-isoprenylcysteine O-methyltransferase Ste14